MTKTFKELRESTSVDEISLKSLSKTISKATSTKNVQLAMKKSKDKTRDDLAAMRKRLDSLKAGYAAESVENLEELTAAEKKLINQMYDKKGNLTPLGKKVFAAGQKNESLELDEISTNTLSNYMVKSTASAGKRGASARHQDKRIAGQSMADKKIRKKMGYSSTAKVAATEATELDEAPRRKGAPKMTGDSIAIQRAKDAEHAKAMGRSVKTGRKLPKKTMTSTQMSLASLRREEVELDEAKGMNMNLKLINKIKKSGVVKTGSMSKDGSKKEETNEVLDTPKAMQSYRDKAKYSKDRAANSAAAKMLRSKDGFKSTDTSDELKTMDKRTKGLKMADRNATNKTVKALRKEQVSLNRSSDKLTREATIPDGQTAMTKRPELTNNDKDKLAKIRKMMDREKKTFKALRRKEDVSEAKKGGYDIYHKDFSGAMQHAYAAAKKNYGITIKPSEIDNKVASGPRKPSSGKTNTYRLEGDKGAIQVQVYNTGSKYELNMYKE